MTKDTNQLEEPTCPDCGADWVRSAPRFSVDGGLSDMRLEEAASVYDQNKEEYDDTPVAKFACGNVVPISELPRKD